jgi:uncharacterized protein YbjT (DUF2867 family)
MTTILVTTPTGHIGGRVVRQLLADPTPGRTVRVLARDPARLPDAVRAAADVRVGAIDEGPALADALAGADAFFLLVPPPRPDVPDWLAWMRAVGERATRAAAAAGTPRTVLLSSTGAHRDDLGPVSVLGEIEEWLRAALPNVAALRPGYFFENTFGALPTIAEHGMIFGAFDPALEFPQVATRDIGDAAARWLSDASWTGHPVRALHGPRDLSMAALAAAAAAALGRPIGYAQVPVEAIGAAMAGAGLGPSMVRGYERLMGGLAASGFEHPEPRTAETTTPTEFGDWAREALAPALAAAGAAPAAA